MPMRTDGLMTAPVRGTQSFVGTLSTCWHRPSLTGLEVLWRWSYGVPAIWAAIHFLHPAITAAHLDWAALQQMTVLDPMAAANTLGQAIDQAVPPVWAVLRWLGPVLIAVWIVVSSIGRTVVLRRADASLQSRPGTVMVLQAIRMVALGCSFWVWFRLLEGAANIAIVKPVAAGEEPNLVLYCAAAIVTTLGLFVLWGAASWALSVAPLLAMLRGLGVGESLRAAFRLGPLKAKLVEINLVMGIVKIALIVLAMVFSACPLPFESVTTPGFLHEWWFVVTLLYFVGSDFFHVARLVAYLELWRAFHGDEVSADGAAGNGISR
jgi:hypothetical protein